MEGVVWYVGDGEVAEPGSHLTFLRMLAIARPWACRQASEPLRVVRRAYVEICFLSK